MGVCMNAGQYRFDNGDERIIAAFNNEGHTLLMWHNKEGPSVGIEQVVGPGIQQVRCQESMFRTWLFV